MRANNAHGAELSIISIELQDKNSMLIVDRLKLFFFIFFSTELEDI